MTASDARRAWVALYLLASGVLVLEVTLTRVFSVMTWHHCAYAIISLAMLGFGAASSFLTASRRFAGEHYQGRLVGRYGLAFCLTTMLCFAVATKIRFYPTDIYLYGDYSNAFSLLLLNVIVGVPFFFAGVCVGYLMSRAGDAINRLYFADLLGAGTGALLSIPGINYLGVESTIYAVAAGGGIVALLHARGDRTRRLRVGSLAGLALALLLAGLATRGTVFPVYFPPAKVDREVAMKPHYTRWHAMARVDVVDLGYGRRAPGEPASRRDDAAPGGDLGPRLSVTQDGAAGTHLPRVKDGDVSKLHYAGRQLRAAAYAARPKPARVLVIGVGGGMDVVAALYCGAGHITGVEINPVVVDVVKDRYADYVGRIFERPNVELIAAEGRHYLTTLDEQFGLIQLTGTDTLTASLTGAYALSENYLYTIEAMHDFWSHLSEDGILSISRPYNPYRQTLRLVATEIEALHQLGITEVERHFMVIGERGAGLSRWAGTLLGKRSFTESEATACREWVRRSNHSMLYDPYRGQDGLLDLMIRATPAERQAMIAQYPDDIRPTTDDSPFFFHYHRWRSPSHQPFDTPATQNDSSGVSVGLLLLVAGLVQIGLLSAGLILVPLLIAGDRLRHIPNKGRLLVYFGALGSGFITVEIALLQKYTVFVGGPVYAMAVTLFAILAFSGLGALLARRIGQLFPRALTVILLALVGAIVAETMFVNYAVPRLMFLSHGMRCLVTVLALAPLALLMGMPFPTGLRVAQRLGQPIVPWAWGVNAVATTLGAFACVLMSMELGFTVSLTAAALAYLVALLTGLDELGRSQAQT